MTIKIGIIGAGGRGQAFAKAGYEVIISNIRGAENLSALAKSLGGNVKAGSVQEAAKAEVVFLAVPWKHLPPAVSGVTSCEGRIVIDLRELSGGRKLQQFPGGPLPTLNLVKLRDFLAK